jgi:hypothetical protein
MVGVVAEQTKVAFRVRHSGSVPRRCVGSYYTYYSKVVKIFFAEPHDSLGYADITSQFFKYPSTHDTLPPFAFSGQVEQLERSGVHLRPPRHIGGRK